MEHNCQTHSQYSTKILLTYYHRTPGKCCDNGCYKGHHSVLAWNISFFYDMRQCPFCLCKAPSGIVLLKLMISFTLSAIIFFCSIFRISLAGILNTFLTSLFELIIKFLQRLTAKFSVPTSFEN